MAKKRLSKKRLLNLYKQVVELQVLVVQAKSKFTYFYKKFNLFELKDGEVFSEIDALKSIISRRASNYLDGSDFADLLDEFKNLTPREPTDSKDTYNTFVFVFGNFFKMMDWLESERDQVPQIDEAAAIIEAVASDLDDLADRWIKIENEYNEILQQLIELENLIIKKLKL